MSVTIIVVIVDAFMIVNFINIITDYTVHQQRLAAQFHLVSILLSRGDHRQVLPKSFI
jgi:hypothetical protein